jgi:hypothetical protein
MNTKTELVITSRSGEKLNVSQLRGRVAVVGFLSKAACHTTPALELLDQVFLELGSSNISAFGCIVDLDPGEELRDYYPFTIQVGSASRRHVAEFLERSMSGFALPQFLVFDRRGKQRLVFTIPRGDTFWEVVDNFKLPISAIVNEPSATQVPQPYTGQESAE